jgi:oxaloacetate decarboxylase alpha subunit
VVTQATHNITTGERYKVVPQGVIQYVAGWFGEPPASIDQNILDKISSLPQAKSIFNTEPPEPTIQELRQKIGTGLSDDEFLLRLVLTDEEIEGLQPIKTQYP